MKRYLKFPPIIHTCKKCGEDFKTYKCHIKNGMGDYCSMKCSRPAVYKKCLNCNKEFRIHPYEINIAKFCSSKCRAIAVGKKHSGKNNHMWKGGVTTRNKLERRKFQETMQKLIFERDNYICQICDRRGLTLHVDHIKSWSDYPELRFDPENCRTLCLECHYFITFGRDISESTKTWCNNLGKEILI